MKLLDYIRQFNTALADETTKMRAAGGQRIFVTDGRYLGARNGESVYSFTADSELHFPDGIRIELECRGQKQEGQIISIAGFDLVLALQDSIGQTIPTATLHTSPWFLLEELKKRLGEIGLNPNLNNRMLDNLLTQNGVANPPVIEHAENLLHRMRQQLGQAIDYNPYQLRAVGHVLNNEVSFIWGPPGTGKTQTLGLVVAALVEAGKSVLVMAHSNVAVDTAMLNVAKYLQQAPPYKTGQVLRYGITYLLTLHQYPDLHVREITRRQNPQLITKIEQLEKKKRSYTAQSRAENLVSSKKEEIKTALDQVKCDLEPLYADLAQKELALVRAAKVVGCTLSKAIIAAEVYERSFDAVLVDEASMAYIPHCVFAGGLAKQHLVILGDFKQLAPISQADTPMSRLWLKRDIFDQAGISDLVNQGQTDKRLVLLAVQYRMHPDIAAIPNELFYHHQLKNGLGITPQMNAIVSSSPGASKALVFYDLSELDAACYSDPESHSRFNFVSALVTIKLAYNIIQTTQHRVGVITPYSAQSRLINRLARDLKLPAERIYIATVHRFQGAESEVILFDAVEGSPKRKAGQLIQGVEDSTAMRLANVAISRAKGKFVMLVNNDYIQTNLTANDSFRQLIDKVESQVPAHSMTWSGHEWQEALPGLTFFTDSRLAVTQMKSDLVQAKEEIAIAWPDMLPSQHFSEYLRQCNAVRFFITGTGSHQFLKLGLPNAQIWENRSHHTVGIVCIDHKRLWIYTRSHISAYYVLRFDFSQATKLLRAFWRLVPEEEKRDTMTERMAHGKSPFTLKHCPKCNGIFSPQVGKYGAYFGCIGCGYSKKITVAEATDIARLTIGVCGKCGGQIKGRSGRDGVFLGCVNYPKCDWTKSLRDVI